MDTNTLLLLFATFAAFCWWFKIQLDDNKALVKKIEKHKKECLKREKLVKQLSGKL